MVCSPMAKARNLIPLCRSRFLQDVTIALGRRSLKSLRYGTRTLRFDVSEENVNGVMTERLDSEARTRAGKMTKVVLWEDGLSWVHSGEKRVNVSIRPEIEIH